MLTELVARFFTRRFAPGLALFGVLVCGSAQAADKPTSGQRAAAQEFLAAVASGDATEVAFALHPAELDALRLRLLGLMRDEAKNNDNLIRSRLFGSAMPLADLERLTGVSFYAALARRLYLTAREYREVNGIAAIPDRDGAVLVVVRGKPPREKGTVETPVIVAVKPYGKDWKAAIPAEIEAQIDDLVSGRRGMGAARPASGAAAAPPEVIVPPGIVELLSNAEKALSGGNCDEYYQKIMSPNFRRVTAQKAREDLIASCRKSGGTRDMLLATLHAVRGLKPRFEYEGARAVYDLSGEGLPYDRFVLEQVDKRWYVAE